MNVCSERQPSSNAEQTGAHHGQDAGRGADPGGGRHPQQQQRRVDEGLRQPPGLEAVHGVALRGRVSSWFELVTGGVLDTHPVGRSGEVGD
jgi:hypothetical protein